MKNLLNLRWLHGSPNQTGETLTRENRLGIATCLNPMRTLLITLFLLTLGVGQMWGYTVYLYTGDFTNWENQGDGVNPKFVVYVGSTNYDMTSLGDHWYSANVGSSSGTAYIKRCKSTDGTKWNEFSVSLSSANNAVRTTNWDDGGYIWYVVGDNWGGLGDWSETKTFTGTGKSTFSITLSNVSNSSSHKFKFKRPGTWDGTVGYSSKVSCVNGTVYGESGDGSNIVFQPYITGSVTITYDGTNIVITCPKIPITLNKNGGNADGSAGANVNGSTITITNAPTHATAGYTVTGYYAESGCSNLVADKDGTLANTTVSGFINSGKWTATVAKTLYAKWTNQYTITFNQHDPSFAGTESTTATYGSAMPSITVPSKTGYTFGGYFTGTNGSGTKYYNADGTSARTWNLTAATTLHAYWIGNTYQVAFDANEGSGTMANEDFTYGAAATALTSNTYTREGYYFLGWNTNADGSGTDYYNGKSVQNLTSTEGGIVTLYAQWAKKYTVYFILAGVGWNPPYAKAKITFDGQTYYPITGSNVWSSMTSVSKGIYLANVSFGGNHNFSLYKIEGIPVGAQIDFSSNSSGTSNVGYMSWTPEKPYFMYGNSTWYGIDKYAVDPSKKDTIVQSTEMVVRVVKNTGSVSLGDFGINEDGTAKYAIVELEANTAYRYKYRNWITGTWSGYQSANVYIMNENTTTGVSAVGDMNASPGQDVFFYTTVAGEYKFMLTWNNTTPQTQMYYPVGVSLGALDVTQAVKGATTTVTLKATPAKNYLITNPTYYYQMSTDNGKNWTTIATSSNKTYAYTFAAQTCKFRVILENDAKLKSTSDTRSFTAYSTKSFYVYNPYNNSTNKWRWLHLYTWDSNNDNTKYNGNWPGGYIHCTDAAGTHGTSCLNGNDIVAMGNNWFYITINATANCFMLVGEETYSAHQTVTCYVNNYIEGGKYMIYTENSQNKVVAYDAKGASDYRLKYTYGSPAKLRYSPIYNTTLDGTTVTASMWMDASSGTSLTIQQGTGNDTWADRKTYTNSSDGFGELVDIDHRDHGYVFQMQVTLNTGTPDNSSVSNVALYNGSYYVRTDGLNGGWNDYKKSDHAMHHSAKSLEGTPAYDYYLCKWIGSSGTNVKFTVANDYNPELVESLERDVNSTDPLYNRQTIPQATNVRFSWNTRTNTLTRAYLSAATDASSRFLVLVETSDTKGKIYREDGKVPTGDDKISGLNNNELIFADMGNWVYQLSMKANPQAKAQVTAKYNNKEQEFIPSTTLIDGTGDSKYSYRIIYDFKTNILTNAWVADGANITTTIDLNTNVMVIRNGQNAAAQIHFEGGQVINAKKLVAVMQFEYDNMVGKMNTWNSAAYQYCMYYISFPFNVKVSDIFGIGEMGIDWKLQYYDGAERASKGFFEGDGTTTFWKDVPANGTLNAYEGYSLLLNRVKFNDKSTDIWENKGAGSSVYLYFPSTADAENIKEQSQTIHVPEHTCTINRTFTDSHGNEVNHMNTDSHWNMMGTPLFEDKTASTIGTPSGDGAGATTLKYFYAWNSSTNTLQAAAALNEEVSFSSMYSYMVQYAGDVTFRGSRVVPNAIAAREKVETKNYNIKLQVLDAEDNEINRTFVTLEEGASADFVLNEDMYMVTNKLPVNIYTFAGNYDVAANVLPLETTTVPVGVTVKTAGTYTFSMPSHFDGTVTLVDTYAQTRTNLGIEDYTVNLEEGTFNSRFLLELNIHQAPTAIDGVSDGTLKDGKAHKFLQNGVMYILQNGVMYDAQGKRVK